MIFHGKEYDEVPSLCNREAYKALNSLYAEVDYVELRVLGMIATTQPLFLPWLFPQTKASITNTYESDLTYLE